MMKEPLNNISSRIIHAAITVHKELGPGLLESIYQTCLILELQELSMHVESEVPLPVVYKGKKLMQEFRLDLVVEDTIIVELKSVKEVSDVHLKQLLTYLRLAGKPLGLLINFNTSLLKNGIHRIINK